MPDTRFEQPELFLQWLWGNLFFDFTSLKTTCGKEIVLISPGRQNATDGPDFKGAEIEIEGIRWHGDIEIHTKSQYWYSHGHHQDGNFNPVILHVVADSGAMQAVTENGSRPFTLNLLPYLPEQLKIFLQQFEQGAGLACAPSMHLISPDVFHQQIEKAHREYFEKKTNDFLTLYEANLPMSQAWKKALFLAIWDGLGISQNRQQMRTLARRLFTDFPDEPARARKRAFEIADFEIHWNLKAVRPGNRPAQRVEQALILSNFLMTQPFGDFLHPDAIHLWKEWRARGGLPARGHLDILFGTVYLPALFVLSQLAAHTSLSEQAFNSWLGLKSPVPPSLLIPFSRLNLPASTYQKKLGAVHQLTAYCKAGKCSECLVLKNVIAS